MPDLLQTVLYWMLILRCHLLVCGWLHTSVLGCLLSDPVTASPAISMRVLLTGTSAMVMALLMFQLPDGHVCVPLETWCCSQRICSLSLHILPILVNGIILIAQGEIKFPCRFLALVH